MGDNGGSEDEEKRDKLEWPFPPTGPQTVFLVMGAARGFQFLPRKPSPGTVTTPAPHLLLLAQLALFSTFSLPSPA